MSGEKKCDVLIIGAGMAGGLLARLLRLQQPDLDVVLIDKREQFDYWIGESTVEVFADYAERVLGLGPYLMRHQIVKHGLRFFFDSEQRDLHMHELAETGRGRYQGPIPSYQLDRARFDQDIVDMNRAMGVEVHQGTSVLTKGQNGGNDPVQIDRDGGHLVATSMGPIRCRWLVDAAGRSSPLGKMFNLVEKDPRHPVNSYWARFKNHKILDEVGPKEWRRRVDRTIRYDSTNHFMYKGYWVWHIPLDENLVSIGVSNNREMVPLDIKNGDDLLAWLRTHQCFRDILVPGTEVVDYMQYVDVSRCAKTQFSPDRWFLTGMSGVVVDAYLSQTGVYNSYSNRLINELIKTDRAGDDARFRRQAHHFSIFMRMKYEALLRSTKYPLFGSYDAFVGWRTARQNIYWNREIPLGSSDLAQVVEQANAHDESCGCSFEKAQADWVENSCSAALNRIADEYVAFLEKQGSYYDLNKDHYCESTERFALGNKVHDPRDFEHEAREDRITYEASVRYFVRRMLEHEQKPWREAAFRRAFEPDWTKKQTLAAVVELLRDAPDEPVAAGPDEAVFWHPKGPIDAVTLRDHPWYAAITPSVPGAVPQPKSARTLDKRELAEALDNPDVISSAG